VTQIFFPGEPLNETDLLLNAVSDKETRNRLIFQPTDPKIGQQSGAPNTLGYRLDFVLRGRRRTPELD
jgi:protocatechuate 3,4-dioxygenase beta subunit